MDFEQQLTARGTAARIGITLLNLLTAGLGMLRLGRGRLALGFFILPSAVMFGGLWLLIKTKSFTANLVAWLFGVAIIVVLSVLVGSMTLTWRMSKFVSPNPKWWQRWYGILLSFVAAQVAVNGLVDWAHGHYKPYVITSGSMEPTLSVGTRVVAAMQLTGPPQRGDVVLFKRDGNTYLFRVMAIAGDRISVRGGVPLLNGKALQQVALAGAPERFGQFSGVAYREYFPGQTRFHLVLEAGNSDADEFSEVTVPAGHVFLLGDNRDNASDSRYGNDNPGFNSVQATDMVSLDRLQGQILFRTFDDNFRWLGTEVD